MSSIEKKAAEDILKSVNAVYVPEHEYAAADPKDFRRLDLRFYDRFKQALEKQGFRHLEDQEDLTISRAMKVRTMARIMVSEDGAIGAGCYHYLPGFFLQLLNWAWGGFRVFDLDTALTDGNYLMTTTAPGIAAALSSPPQIQGEYLPKGTDIMVVLKRHRERLQSYLEAHPDVKPVVIRSVQDIRDLSSRVNNIKAAYRNQLGGVTREELSKLSKYNTQDQLDEIHQEIQNKKNKQDQP